jgi:hypothetical protein
MASFAERHGIALPEVAITVREDAPKTLRTSLWSLCEKASFAAHLSVIEVAQLVLDHVYFPEFANDRPLVEMAKQALLRCPWNQVYDVAERMWALLDRPHGAAGKFESDLNFLFRQEGIGWQMTGGVISVRSSDALEATVSQAIETLNATGRTTAEGELREAFRDLSRRPEPDITGAIQHAGAALECVARDVAGDAKKTLGDILKLHRGLLQKPLDDAADKLWGFASQYGRHVQEGRNASMEEALLVIGLAATLAGFLAGKK